VEPKRGFEPLTYRLQIGCATIAPLGRASWGITITARAYSARAVALSIGAARLCVKRETCPSGPIVHPVAGGLTEWTT
jgi:hypothetical protein